MPAIGVLFARMARSYKCITQKVGSSQASSGVRTASTRRVAAPDAGFALAGPSRRARVRSIQRKAGPVAGAAYHCSLGTILGCSGSPSYAGVMICMPYSLNRSRMFRCSPV
jgi:hypothetical protein